jgi:hypothetical protein
LCELHSRLSNADEPRQVCTLRVYDGLSRAYCANGYFTRTVMRMVG